MLTWQSALRKDLHAPSVKLQHRHFATIASAIRSLPDEIDNVPVAEHFADCLSHTNPHFDRSRFLAACLGGHDND